MRIVTTVVMAGMLGLGAAPSLAQTVRPNGQNLMTGPSYWTPQQRRLNIPGATANPSLKRQALPYTAPQRGEPQALPRPTETPVPAETPKE